MSLLATELSSSKAKENIDFSSQGDGQRDVLESFWKRCSGLNIEWFDRLWEMHCDPMRHYHTVVHLQEMFQYLEILEKHNIGVCEVEIQAIILAIFFHDCVYEVKSATNEEDSAKIFQQYASEYNLSVELTNLVVDYILATKKHSVGPNSPLGKAILLDLDMSVLGKSLKAYMNYASLIRKEYSYVPHETYCSKRADILEDFLKENRIYGTDGMFEAFEAQARDNIAAEVSLLRQGKIPK